MPPNASGEVPALTTCAEARARRAKLGAKRRQASAKRMARQGGLRVGVGGLDIIKPNQASTPATPSPQQGSPFRVDLFEDHAIFARKLRLLQ